MHRGRPRKLPAARNTTGLHNQSHPQLLSDASEPNSSSDEHPTRKRARSRSCAPSPEDDSTEDVNWHPSTVVDSLKFIAGSDESDDESDMEEVNAIAFPGGCNTELEVCTWLVEIAVNAGDDPSDETWLPPKERAAHQKKSSGRPKEYKKGPDMGSKAKRTQRCYKTLLQDQTSLTDFGFAHSLKPKDIVSPRAAPPAASPTPFALPSPNPDVSSRSGAPIAPSPSHSPNSVSRILEGDSDTANVPGGGASTSEDTVIPWNNPGLVPSPDEAWEDELEEQEHGGIEVRGWKEL